MDKSPHKIKLVFYAYPSGLLNTFKVLLIYYEKLARQKKMYDFFKNYYIAVRVSQDALVCDELIFRRILLMSPFCFAGRNIRCEWTAAVVAS